MVTTIYTFSLFPSTPFFLRKQKKFQKNAQKKNAAGSTTAFFCEMVSDSSKTARYCGERNFSLKQNPKGKNQGYKHHRQTGAGVQHPGPPLLPGPAALGLRHGQDDRAESRRPAGIRLLGGQDGLRLAGQAVPLGCGLPAAQLGQVNDAAGMLNKAGSFIVCDPHLSSLHVVD